MANPQVLLHAWAAQIEIAVFEPQIFVHAFINVDRKRRHARAIQDFEALDRDLDVTRRQARILGAGRAASNGAAHAKHVFVAQVLRFREAGVLRIEDDLRNPLVVANVDEDQASMVAAPIDPAVELDLPAFVGGAQHAA
jgi:hypothetical protein